MVNTAFLAFQLGAGGESFSQYLDRLGLSDHSEAPAVHVTKEEAIAKAEKIKRAIRGTK
jgi:hypothetical protein